MNELLFSLGLLAAFAGGTIAVLGFGRKLRLRMLFGDHTGLEGIIIQVLAAIMIALSQT